jgi:predicted RNA-binding protein with PIN domain
VVFDGSQQVVPGNRFRYRGIQVLFSGAGKTADDRIRQFILNSPRPESIEVVTSDREIQNTARNLGCWVTSSPDFWKRLTRSSEPEGPGREAGESDRELSDREVQEWLNLFQQRGADDED